MLLRGAQFLATGSGQTLSVTNTLTQVTFGVVVFNAGSYFAANAWTPPNGAVRLAAKQIDQRRRYQCTISQRGNL
jgi:hypothetical protein